MLRLTSQIQLGCLRLQLLFYCLLIAVVVLHAALPFWTFRQLLLRVNFCLKLVNIMLVGFVEFEFVHLLHLFLFHPVNYLHSLFLLLLLLSLLPHFVELNQIAVNVLINILKLNHLLLFRFFMLFYYLQKLLTFLTTPTLMTTHLLMLRRRFALYLLQLMINILHSPLFLINLLDLSLNLLQFSLKPLFMSLFQYSDALEMVFLDIFVFHQFLFLLA